jgi:hypothetical protein
MPQFSDDTAALVAAQLTDTWARSGFLAASDGDEAIRMLLSAHREFFGQLTGTASTKPGYTLNNL